MIASTCPIGGRVGLVAEPGSNPASVAVSRDGRCIAYVAGDSAAGALLYVRPRDALEAHALAGTEGATMPFWSPDGKQIDAERFLVNERSVLPPSSPAPAAVGAPRAATIAVVVDWTADLEPLQRFSTWWLRQWLGVAEQDFVLSAFSA